MWSLIDLVLPRSCGGCARPGIDFCDICRVALSAAPIPVTPRVGAGVPVWALGPYAGPHRRAVIEAKERRRRDLGAHLGYALAAGVRTLREHGELDPWQLHPLVLVPAPSRARAARTRGGDPVVRMADGAVRALGSEGARVARCLRLDRRTRDSVGLSARARRDNLAGRVSVLALPGSPSVVLVDDVVTTGATSAESVHALARHGVRVEAVLVVAAVP